MTEEAKKLYKEIKAFTLWADNNFHLYDEKGEHLAKEVQTFLDIDETDLLKLAVCLRRNADDKKIWDAALDRNQPAFMEKWK